jgi:hypothetical protein
MSFDWASFVQGLLGFLFDLWTALSDIFGW